MSQTAKQQLRQKLNEQLMAGQTVAKWMPREKSSKGNIAREIMQFFGISAKFYRKAISDLTNVVEQKMCAKQWDQIEFGKIPSLAAARYNKAFLRNATEAYTAYKGRLVSGEEKINANAVYPYDVIKTINHGGDAQIADAQWNSLPNYMGESSVLAMVDVSGSMTCSVGGNKNLSCLNVAVSLGLYCADKNKGAFKDTFLTFSNKPEALVLKGTLSQKLSQMKSSEWGMNTNLKAAFDEILRIAVQGSVSQEDMPQTLLILSDMQFDQCTSFDDSAYEMIQRKYRAAGYNVPNIVFWNLNARDNVPVKFNQRGVALVSGFSPSLMKSVLSGNKMTPWDIMMATVDVPRYNVLDV